VFASLLFGLLLVSAIVLFTTGVGVWGLNIPVTWAFAIHNYVWWLGIGHAGTLISALLLLLGRDWRNSLNRFAETMTLFAVVCAGIYPILHLGRPWFFYWMFPYPATMNVWPQFRSPLEWDIWAVLTYLTVSVVFWYIGLVPDLAAARDRAQRWRWQVFFGVLSLGWRGSAMHWVRWNQCYRLIAALAVPLVVSVHSEVSLLFASGTIPGWHSTIFPPYFVMGAAFSGFAVVSLIAISLRTLFDLRNLVTDDHLDVLGKVLLATGLMTAYGYIFEVFDALYSGNPHEVEELTHRLFGPHWWIYWGAVLFNFILLQPLWWRTARRTPWMLFSISLSVAIGMWLERDMILVTSLAHDFLVSSWRDYVPTFWDWATFAGTLGLFLLPFLLIIRLLPVISIFETKEILHDEHEERAHG
jgi:molybdopterin-containing oxidoreductase family membrane subunit